MQQEPVEVAVRLDAAVAAKIATFDEATTVRALSLARKRLQEDGSTHELQSLDSRRARAALVDCREAYYADVLAGRRSANDGTVTRWIRAWADAGLPPLDATAILQLPG